MKFSPFLLFYFLSASNFIVSGKKSSKINADLIIFKWAYKFKKN